jgi:hypothetical protein
MKFYGKIESGKMVLQSRWRMAEWLAGQKDMPVEIVIRRIRKGRSLPQNSYYWGVVIPILSQHLGYEKDEMHEALKFEFLKIHDDRPLATARSTTDLSTTEFKTYIEQIQRWAAEFHGCYIPDPGEGTFDDPKK